MTAILRPVWQLLTLTKWEGTFLTPAISQCARDLSASTGEERGVGVLTRLVLSDYLRPVNWVMMKMDDSWWPSSLPPSPHPSLANAAQGQELPTHIGCSASHLR